MYRTNSKRGSGHLPAVVASIRAADSSLRALNPPASLAKLDKRLVRVEKRVAAYAATLAREHKKVTFSSLATPRFIALSNEEERLWISIGATVCANAPFTAWIR
jgi:hypothetical protein